MSEDGLPCPLCKGAGTITSPDLRIDTMSNVVFCKAGSVRVTAAESLFLKALMNTFPAPFDYERGFALFPYGHSDPRNSMGVLACKLSKKLKPLGYAVRAERSIGFKLVRYIGD